ncbi:MAG: sugar O-acetyltransferase [Litorilituus sp.]|jgi:maltose O-acetyltransferase|nr:sugar O-acetyltransferase [Litorilituus sp.]
MKIRFNSLTSELRLKRKAVHELCRQFSRSPSKGNLKRIKVLFQSCSDDVFFEAGLHFDYGEHISIGARTFINSNCTLLDAPRESGKKITIGEDCLFGPNVQILAVSHDMQPTPRLAKHNYADDIIIGNNVWLGGGVIILAGVIIADNSVVGAGSVVTKNIEADSFYAGNPASKIRDL